ncbi:bifunctional proline dehydrogenase/L-glutamate gamma-semialdehyde dehydrogenase PutA [Hansschlegelia beijingensis]|uniref:Bifunctional protein PutA n=1 Tax=Hansschlegelia beijingensis TaxID=1133344 RepID=A0A7W6CZ56_9HYPH|nr:bifunctional proline dehydrogenase/L-glutamate gamma-semialdehyde dehydrogenase PutA [Hansschlegelia beijingensis]MBB3971460.1 RHH-type proline utilization regulon transcriptional repressor/proline dehydrogenase/delta 1-pyrroline-5-carboxylate dehydrogenase [Hansschlegelia beijingensis]
MHKAASPDTPFARFAELPRREPSRAAVTAANLRPEPDCLPPLIAAARLAPEQVAAAQATAGRLVEALRAKRAFEGMEGLIHEYSLSSREGVALMCLAEALLRIPDPATRDALIREKIGHGDWRAHLGHSPSLFVNAATWGLLVTGRLAAPADGANLWGALKRLVARGGEPVVRAAVDLAMRLLGEQFVTGRTIEEALARARKREQAGFRHSFDMLGEAALTAADAENYLAAYREAVVAIGQEAAGRGWREGPGISIKLSALHPRYQRAQRGRVMAELVPRLTALAQLARGFDIGLNIDAEEADRLELSLDVFEALCLSPELAGWDGAGFVVQAYMKRAPFVIDWLADLARRSDRRIMTRLVKGAYWDSEIKRAQTLGLADFPVFTRKIHTDVSFLACARRMLEAGDALYPQFATHNAMTLASVIEMAGRDRPASDYEFQCLHGMGEPLYEEVVGAAKLGRPCRIYAPVGDHETLLAYLVRRLLENGANSSFVNRIADDTVSTAELLADPVAAACAVSPVGAPHEEIAAPARLFGPERANSAGLDLADESVLAGLAGALGSSARSEWSAAPGAGEGTRRPVRNPARPADVVGHVTEASPAAVVEMLDRAERAAARWPESPPMIRAAILERAAALMEARSGELIGLIVREAGRTAPNALAELREAVDFLRYYAAGVRGWSEAAHRSLGPIVCISPWNFPLSIFTGQVSAALAAGNVVLAKPAEETPLTAAAAVALLHEAGIPKDALQLVPGDGEVGAALVDDPSVQGVLFTGSTEVARLIQRRLARRLGPNGAPTPLIAETGGQNALIADSSALPEQVVADALASAFDSAGQRCSALRLLCLQEDVADRLLDMLKGGMAELTVGDPASLATDVGPVISDEARRTVEEHVEAMRQKGFPVTRAAPRGPAAGSFVEPTLIEIPRVAELSREVFGPVLHVVRYARDRLDELIGEINATGYALTFGLHTRIDETVTRALARISAGNLYVNRNIIGAVVGSQPFGGHGLSGTGPKAGGPLYLRRLLAWKGPDRDLVEATAADPWAQWLSAAGYEAAAARCRRLAARSPLGVSLKLPGPAGEQNTYELRPGGAVLCRARAADALFVQIGAALATGNVALVDAPPQVEGLLDDLPETLRPVIRLARLEQSSPLAAALVEDQPEETLALLREMAARPGPVVPVHVVPAPYGDEAIGLEWLVRERSVSVNLAAVGGDAGLMSLDV